MLVLVLSQSRNLLNLLAFVAVPLVIRATTTKKRRERERNTQNPDVK